MSKTSLFSSKIKYTIPVFVILIYVLWSLFISHNFKVKTELKEHVKMEIPDGMNLNDLIDLIQEKGSLRNVWSFRLMSSNSLLATACSAAILALSGPLEVPVPIIAVPFSDITVFTSAKSTLIKPGLIMISEIPLTAPPSTSLACLNASSILQSSPRTSRSF